MTMNVSLFALPVYWFVVMLTRGLSIFYVRHMDGKGVEVAAGKNDNGNAAAADNDGPVFSNASPYSADVAAGLARRLSPAAFRTNERFQAAHRNGLENMPLFFAAVILGNLVGLDALELSLVAWLFVAARIAYVPLYVGISGEAASWARTAAFSAGVLCCLWLLLRAAVFTLYDYQAVHAWE